MYQKMDDNPVLWVFLLARWGIFLIYLDDGACTDLVKMSSVLFLV